jgi:L-alanine-DL-glutamate epimerase-like enolase superfamily enzyme
LVLSGCGQGPSTPATQTSDRAVLAELDLARAKDSRGRENLILVMTDTDGHRGLSPVGRFSDDKHQQWRKILQAARPLLLGRDVLEHDANWTLLRPHVGSLMNLSKFDCAGWDLHGKRQGKPVYALLGRKKRDRLLVYWSSHLRPRTFEGFVEWARRVAAHGKVKAVKVFATHHHNPEEQWPYGGRVDPDEHFRLLKEVRRIIGPDVMLLTDLNFGFTFEQALAFGKRVDADPDINLAYYEEPCKIDIEHYKVLTAQLETGISALDIEGHAAHEMRLEWIEADALDMCRFDLRANGGITPAMKVMQACRKRPDIVFNFHSHQIEAAHILAICTEEETGPWEDWGPGQDGYEPVPEGPGIGYDIDVESMRMLTEASR